jgi:hypothetical protein
VFDLFESGSPQIVVQGRSEKLAETSPEVVVEPREGREKGRLASQNQICKEKHWHRSVTNSVIIIRLETCHLRRSQ